jgi:hypothetical protein
MKEPVAALQRVSNCLPILRLTVAEQAKPRKVEITAGTDAQPAISTSG